MSDSGTATPKPVALGLRAGRGGAVLVGVALGEAGPAVILSSFLATADEADPLSLRPYGVAAAMPRESDGGASAEAQAAVAEGRRRQARIASEGLNGALLQMRQDGWAPVAAALLVNRAGWITDLLSYSLAWAEHVPVAEGLAVRDALRHAAAAGGLPVKELDETSLPGEAAAALGLGSAELAARLTALGAAAGRPWRREQKLACLAAWVTLAAAA